VHLFGRTHTHMSWTCNRRVEHVNKPIDKFDLNTLINRAKTKFDFEKIKLILLDLEEIQAIF